MNPGGKARCFSALQTARLPQYQPVPIRPSKHIILRSSPRYAASHFGANFCFVYDDAPDLDLVLVFFFRFMPSRRALRVAEMGPCCCAYQRPCHAISLVPTAETSNLRTRE